MSDHSPRVVLPPMVNLPHIDSGGVCDCECSSCVSPNGRVCICPDCTPDACEIHEANSP